MNVNEFIPTLDSETINQIGITNWVIAILISALIILLLFREVKGVIGDRSINRILKEWFEKTNHHLDLLYELNRKQVEITNDIEKNQRVHEDRSCYLKNEVIEVKKLVMACPERMLKAKLQDNGK